jgi:hypothetical protein
VIGAEGSRLLREEQQLKIPQEAIFASEEAEALPAESDCPKRKSPLLHFRSIYQLLDKIQHLKKP